MFKELLSLFRSSDSITSMAANFSEMLGVAREISIAAGQIFFGEAVEADHVEISKRDVAINKLERKIRKQVTAHLTLGANAGDVPYSLVLMSIVKDVERIGDYAKNLAEVHHEGGAPVPADALGDELRALRQIVEEVFGQVSDVFATSHADKASAMIERGRDVNRRCDALIAKVARSDYDAATTMSMVLGARYYKRIDSHLLNVLSSVVMPLHKLDYYDERPHSSDDAADDDS